MCASLIYKNYTPPGNNTIPYHMYRISAYLLVVTLTITAALSCTGNKIEVEEVSADSIDNADSSMLHIAILPVKECLVLEYAQNSGLARKMGLKMRLTVFESQMDIDTSMISNDTHICFGDSARISQTKYDSLDLKRVLQLPTELVLLTNKDLKIKKMSELKAKIVGLTRNSQLEEWLKCMSDTCMSDSGEIYHAQINSIRLRSNMLNNGLIDAAILPQPWADSLATVHGHPVLCKHMSYGLGFYAKKSILDDSLMNQQIVLLKKVYVASLDSLMSN